MGEIVLSNDLNVITAEIKTWKSFAGMSVWEIGKRIKHVKENDLTHGNYINWLNEIGIDRSEAYRYMRIAEELPNDDTWQHLSTRALYLITTLPEEQKQEQLERIEQGDSPTVRELQELKKQLKEQEEYIASLKKSNVALFGENQKLLHREPEVVEVFPKDYERIKKKNKELLQQAESLDHSLKLAQSKYHLLESSTAEAQDLKRQIDSLSNQKDELLNVVNATKDLHELEKAFNEFFDKSMAPLKFKGISKYIGATNAVDRVHTLINLAEAWVEEMRRLVPNSGVKIIEGEVIDD